MTSRTPAAESLHPDRLLDWLGGYYETGYSLNPHNDIVRSVEDQIEFRRLLRKVFNRIKAVHGEAGTIHLFPVLPVSAAVDVGRVWMPKADLPLIVYDQNRQRGGFFEALQITPG